MKWRINYQTQFTQLNFILKIHQFLLTESPSTECLSEALKMQF